MCEILLPVENQNSNKFWFSVKNCFMSVSHCPAKWLQPTKLYISCNYSICAVVMGLLRLALFVAAQSKSSHTVDLFFPPWHLHSLHATNCNQTDHPAGYTCSVLCKQPSWSNKIINVIQVSQCRCIWNVYIMFTLFVLLLDSFLLSVEDDLKELQIAPPGEVWLLDCWSSLVGEPVTLLWPLLKDDSCFKNIQLLILTQAKK